MKDSYDRTIDYLRISLTDRCNLRCAYCVPKEGVQLCSHAELLTLEEVQRLVRIFASLGVRKIKYTGGEVLLRKNFSYLLKQTIETEGIEDVGITTNGILLEEKLPELIEAGLKRVNVSLDTFNIEAYEKLSGSKDFHRVLSGILKADSAGLKVRINCVPIDDYFDDNDMTSIALLSKNRNIDVRFIEIMPIGSAKNYHFAYSSKQLLLELEKYFGKAVPANDIETTEKQINVSGREADINEKTEQKTGVFRKEGENSLYSVAEYYRFPDFVGRTGFISPRSHMFCSECRRIRLDCRGFLRLCLSYPDGVDLRKPLREGATDEEIAEMIRKAVLNKPKEHCFSERTVSDSMCSIGG